MDRVKLLSPGKINIGLRVWRKREDGYHDIETVFHEVKLFDEIEMEISDEIEFETNSNEIPRGFENLCLKAVRIFFESFGIHSGVRIYLKKRIPVGAGLGGGSSNSAAVLKGLNILFGVGADDDLLSELGSLIGSDVPFFIKGGTAYATGRGEIIEPIEVKVPYKIVIVYPNVKVSTSWVYGNLNLRSHDGEESLKKIVVENIDKPDKLRELVKNDLEDVVFRYHPIVADVKEKLYEIGAVFSLMSGSGSAVFGFFEKVGEKEKILNAFSSKFSCYFIE
ncbi:4-diphosphocytidyl-2-C-methyl-D-erythritol kinase [Candidatus Kryptonium thompsonii]|uniref:4-diphosphocytidyl-2-C-methyl-D-erythritol kinase n=1 Tax=Candidatus Kryptonium thompsonii TaxID=1633631 RepID=A0A0P1M196_9BACT|nr:4-(cytidine 5'-diphospho)-2-C-methyl-D-erythritol kinase [Candidatus Kryptonium thompsoni]CUS82237.1 4-diphosphocytidyl-2-C-methyl-D-erythritol kinase [Candidatus Kryptonium thompsoni]CUS85702.1 4-diphosphocytidyl-2-C-methyl-D-erythritol kinase [Candidatus Kryptonium thompsoni]CUS88409.1 4-diphosphocytidyl-2-C-methyl-D-erythritol kinase [Candidatus Kryptonium thompsoni]CUS95081.1 4-diphosphocytidyl-2-C-methyl-D-erythritol kinase [Candidatus Kryptonium thompsoni]CUT02233.1 4-diphosphocytidyl